MSSSPHIDRHFVPLRVTDLVDELASRPGLADADRESFRQFCEMVQATCHFEQHKYLLRLKTAYAPFNPDADTKEIQPLTQDRKQQRLNEVFEELARLAKRANFRRISQEDMTQALSGSTPWGLNMDVDLGVFERHAMFARGDVKARRTRRRWWQLWSGKEEDVEVYQRLLLVMKLQPHPRLGSNTDTDHIHIKAFKDIPRVDLEMLLPGARVRLTQYDKGWITFPLLTAILITLWTFLKPMILVLIAAYGLREIAETLGASESGQRQATIAGILLGIAALAFGYGYRTWFNYQHRKAVYSLRLTESLYFQSIGSNAGCMTWLLDEAEEQECRETILAYYYLLVEGNPNGGFTQQELDRRVEAFLKAKVRQDVDFEVDDAIGKLERLEIVQRDGEKYRAKPLQQTLEILDERWDNYFPYNNERLRREGRMN